MTQREIDIIQAEDRLHRQKVKIPVTIIGVDLATEPDMTAIRIEREVINGLNGAHKYDRLALAHVLTVMGEARGAKVERRDDGPNPGYHGHSITLRFDLAGVGAMVDIDNLHGGHYALVHWYNTEHPAQDFTTRFCMLIGDPSKTRPHHKATSCPADWYSLAMNLDAGLCLAARGEAFQPAAR